MTATSLLDRVKDFMADGRWHTIPEIERACGGTQTSVSARLRDLRKKQHGSYRIYSEQRNRGFLWRYRMEGKE